MFSLIPDCNGRLQYNNQFNLGRPQLWALLTQSLNTASLGWNVKTVLVPLNICQGKFVASFLTLHVGSFNNKYWEFY